MDIRAFCTGRRDLNSRKNKKGGFTLAESLVLLLVTSLIIVASMPVITKKTKKRVMYKPGPKDGWQCDRSRMPCTFTPPAKARAFLFFYDLPGQEATVANFGAINIGTITIKANCSAGDRELYKTMDEYKRGELKVKGNYCAGNVERVRIRY